MRSKFIAVLSAIAIALGMVAFTATSASAHHNTINATVSCNTPTGQWNVVWSVTNSESDKTETITSSNHTDIVPVGTELGKGETKTFTQTLSAPTDITLTLKAKWSNDYVNENSGTLSKSAFKGDCTPPLTTVSANATAVNEVCTNGAVTKGYIQVLISTGVSYTITKKGSSTAIAYDSSTGMTGALAPGDYVAVATAAPGNSFDKDKVVTTKSFDLTIAGAGTCSPKYEVAIYIYPLLDATKPASWANSGKQTLIAHRPASNTTDWYTTLPGGLPTDVCGSGWGIQQDIAKLSSSFSADDFPPIVERATGTGVLGWPPIVNAKHQPLSALVGTVPPCGTEVHPGPPTAVSAFETCDTTNGTTSTTKGTITFAAGDWKWYDSANKLISSGVHNYAKGTYVFTVVANSGFKFDTAGTTTLTFTVVVGLNKLNGPCLTQVIPTEPDTTAHDVCGTANDTLTVDSTSKLVDYTVTWNKDHTEATVTATIKDTTKYFFKDGATTSWTYTFTNEPCVVDNSITPTVSDQTCTPVQSVGSAGYTYADGGITVNLDANLEYTITGIDGTVYGPTVVTTAFTALSPGKYKVDVKALNGYVLKGGGTTATFERTVGAGLCAVVFGDPYAVDETCTEQGTTAPGYIWVDFSGNLASEISYQITGGPTPVDYTATQEINNLEPGDYTVTVTAKPGFKLASTMKSVWNFTIHGVETCDLETHPLISTTASYKNLTCSSDGSYTLADTEGVVWFVNGSSTPTPPGTYKVTGATTVNIEAQTTGPDYGWERDAQTKWTFDFTNPVDCLPTLAFTGSDGGNLGLLLAGGFLLFGGTIVAFERRFRANVR
ncbi:MAG TPA: hypothetical protein PKI99_00310 [Terrimesophilobacter sp.]|nr:hypothetical protein [Terrimesophilobacter sp.]